MKNTKYGIKNLKADFGTDEQCLEFIFDALHTRKCSCGGTYRKIYDRRQYQCSNCRFQIAPTAGTIFHKSDTPLSLWFYAIFLFSNAKSGLSAKQLERDLNVTYKTAWRMLKLIRTSLSQDNDFLGGNVEMDEMYLGGKRYGGKDNMYHIQNLKRKTVVIGAVERGGKMRAEVSPDSTAKSIWRFLDRNVNPITSRLLTDGSNRYGNASKKYNREAVNHNKREFVRGDVYTNTIESFWAHVKRSVSGTHKVISKKYVQSYLDGFVWHYNNRHSDSERLSALLGALLRPVK